MISALRKNDKVLTSAGIYGTVVSVDDKEDRVMVRIDDDRGVKVAFSKASIVRVFGGPEDKEKSPKEKAAEV
jgi:preprotein translocase subunit YajC